MPALDDLRAAYGTDLQGSDGGYFVSAQGPPPVATLGFRVAGATVIAIGFGGRDGVSGGSGGQIWC